jgi:ribosomal protein S6--L-glutamate ligase
MHIAILSRNRQLYSTRRLVEAARLRGHEVTVVDPLKCVIDVTSRRPAVHYRGAPLPRFDAVIPRIGASVTFYALAVLRQFEVMGVYPANESVAIGRSRDKLRSLQLLSRAGIGMPVTAFAHSPDDTRRWSSWWAARRWCSSCSRARRGAAWCWRKPPRRRKA